MTMTVGNGVANLMSEETAAPSNPASGSDLLYFDSTSHNLTCLRSTGASCLPSGGGGGGISTITSTGGTLTVTNPTGPTTNLETTGVPRMTCDASTLVAYQHALCVFPIDATTLNSFDGTSGTAIQAIAAPAAGIAILPEPSGGVSEYIAGAQAFGATADIALAYSASFLPGTNVIWAPHIDWTQTASQFAPDTFNYGPEAAPLSDFAGQALFLDLSAAISGGSIATSAVTGGNAGTLYAASDTGTVSGCGAGDAAYTVNTVDGGGGVLTYTITGAGTNYIVTTGCTTSTGGGQPGVGTGFEIDVTAIAQGNGSAIVTIPFTVIPVGDGAITASTLTNGGDATSHPTATITAGHAGSSYITGDAIELSCGADYHVTASGGVVTAISLIGVGTSCTTGAGQSTTGGSGTGLELDVSAVDAGWNVSDELYVSTGNGDAVGHVTAVNGSKQITTYVLDDGGSGYSVGPNVDIFDTTTPYSNTAVIDITAVF